MHCKGVWWPRTQEHWSRQCTYYGTFCWLLSGIFSAWLFRDVSQAEGSFLPSRQSDENRSAARQWQQESRDGEHHVRNWPWSSTGNMYPFLHRRIYLRPQLESSVTDKCPLSISGPCSSWYHWWYVWPKGCIISKRWLVTIERTIRLCSNLFDTLHSRIIIE